MPPSLSAHSPAQQGTLVKIFFLKKWVTHSSLYIMPCDCVVWGELFLPGLTQVGYFDLFSLLTLAALFPSRNTSQGLLFLYCCSSWAYHLPRRVCWPPKLWLLPPPTLQRPTISSRSRACLRCTRAYFRLHWRSWEAPSASICLLPPLT